MTAVEHPAGGLKCHAPRLRPRLYDLLRGLMRALFHLFTRVHVTFLAGCPERGPAIVAVNHLSYFDGPLVFAMLPLRVRPLAADRYRRHPFGLLLAATGAIFVRRGQPDRAAVRATLEVLAEGGCLAVAVEGTRSRDGRLHEGKNGVAYLAARTGAPLIPAAVWGTERIGASLRRLRRPDVYLCLGAPIVLDAPSLDVLSLDISRLDETTRGIVDAIAAMLPARYLPAAGAAPQPGERA
ncbi:MAG TPA: lysophospholipid acyltransferase family protein [Thermoanaerobaculia bacterium]|jgi:1-acyl-sn-glycerol-3-phosphate acyltransferase